MKTFDYAAAWREVAKPAYESLPANVRDLLAQVATEAGGLGQGADLGMPWPDNPQLGEKGTPGSDLRAKFEKIPAEWLSQAARVIYSVGHWYPGKEDRRGDDFDFPGRNQGSHWKFSKYADQSLRERLISAGVATADQLRDNGPFLIHEGAIRICYSSRDSWMWEEVAPATVDGLARARELYNELSAELGKAQGDAHQSRLSTREARENAVYRWFEDLRKRDMHAIGWPAAWWGFMQTEAYMREEDVIRADRLRHQDPEIAKRVLEGGIG